MLRSANVGAGSGESEGELGEEGHPLPKLVHYCQAFSIDWAGEVSGHEAAELPTPKYSRLLRTPLPLPPALPQCSATTCFNCGKEGHEARACPKPKAAVPLFAPRRAPIGPRKAPAFQGRYFDLQPEQRRFVVGQLSEELQVMLGMRPLDPPPYLLRMQRMGFPPGHMGHREPQLAGATDSASGREVELKMYYEAPEEWKVSGSSGKADARAGVEGERVDERQDGQSAERSERRSRGADRDKEPLLSIPGLNVPPPQGADWRRWGWRQDAPVTKVARCLR